MTSRWSDLWKHWRALLLWQAYWILFCHSVVLVTEAHAYIGPGAGFAVAGSFLVMFFAIISGLLALIYRPFRYLVGTIRRRRAYAKSRVKRFVVLGLDGLDPDLTERFMADGALPNFEKLRKQGCFKRLQSSIPPISPVAWSSFQTGSNPGKHNIFDFLTVDRRTYLPRLSSVDIKPSRRKLKFGKYRLPLGKPIIRLLRKSEPFWNILGRQGVFSHIIRVPITFPPEKFNGVMLSAMCTPDLLGTQGTFSHYSTGNGAGNSDLTGGVRHLATRDGGRIEFDLVGPQSPFRTDNHILTCPAAVFTNGGSTEAQIKLNGKRYPMRQGEYTEWIKVEFKAGPLSKINGICRVLLLSTEPEFELYVTAINIDPVKPVMPIAHPAVYSTYLAKRHGSFATLGLAEDTWALNEKTLTDQEFLDQAVLIERERERMFFDALDKLHRGLCVCVFDGTDRIQHAFWRHLDEGHPAHPVEADKHQEASAIEMVYRRMDGIVGRTMAYCDDRDTILMVISDHGFTTFRYGVDLNAWLEQNGYLKVKDGERGRKYLAGVDWSRTQAYALGLAGIYLNLKGREARGIVDPGEEADNIRRDIAAKLMKLKDRATDQMPVKKVYPAPEVYSGPYVGNAPDLIVGFNREYRAAWETAVGEITDEVFHLNTKAWSGDHCVDRSLVPGVLFCNRPVESDDPRLIDIGPTILSMFGIAGSKHMDGRELVLSDS